jgi:DNA-binding XRE family transcriptional regulator
MINAYSKLYLDDSLVTLAETFDLVESKQNIDDFFYRFIDSGVALKFGSGNPKYINMSPIELYREITGANPMKPIRSNFNRTELYWCGYVLAYYQWYSGKSFKIIGDFLPPSKIISMYYPLHEADIMKFVELANELTSSRETNLAKQRKIAGLSQAKLASLSNVSLRSIQLYEQKNKDINKAQAETLYKLANLFGCNIEDLLEK